MRAMRTYAKKKEHANAPVGPCTTFTHCVYGYNVRGEVVFSRRDEMHRRSSASEGRFGVAEPEGSASICEGAENEFEYNYDDIGNRITSFDLSTNRTYTANNLNQYSLISNLCASASLRENTMGSP